jgi:hypothetical protein
MKWQMADWFFVGMFLVFVVMFFVRRGRSGAHRDDGKSDRRPPRAEGEEHERPGPTINM